MRVTDELMETPGVILGLFSLRLSYSVEPRFFATRCTVREPWNVSPGVSFPTR
jgi:hypothetical protein